MALLEQWGIAARAAALLSGYLKNHQAEYYRRLSAIRTDGDWESWIAFFLEGMSVAAAEAERSIIDVASLVTVDRRRLLGSPRASAATYRLFEMLPVLPRFTVEQARQKLETTFPTANAAVKLLQTLGIISETTGQKTNRIYSYHAYVGLLTR